MFSKKYFKKVYGNGISEKILALTTGWCAFPSWAAFVWRVCDYESLSGTAAREALNTVAHYKVSFYSSITQDTDEFLKHAERKDLN